MQLSNVSIVVGKRTDTDDLIGRRKAKRSEEYAVLKTVDDKRLDVQVHSRLNKEWFR